MCRIAGISSRTKPLPEIKELVSQMCDVQKHGGPDDSGVYACPETGLVLGHRRLALIDLSYSGHQPMIYQERYVISFNGEIYNFRSLKEELVLLNWQFHTTSDTEVILAAFAQWNIQSFTRLSGMFAFALYDTWEKELYLVRDASGIKPLYFSVSAHSIEFASEIRAFAELKEKKENTSWPVLQLAYGHIPEPVTTLHGVQSLHKGCFYTYNVSTGAANLQSFAHYSYSDTLSDNKRSQDTIRAAMMQSVSRHLVADAPVGVFLSGGIDSGIIASVASRYQQQYLKTLSIYFNEADFSEKKYQDSIIQKLECKHYQHLLTISEFQEGFPAILQAMDMPSCDGLNTWFISKYAKEQGLKAILSGIGGDELFGGYPSFSRMRIAGMLQALPRMALKITQESSKKLLNRMPYLTLGGIKGLYLFLRGQFTPLQIAAQLGAAEKQIWTILKDQPMLPVVSGLDKKNEASWMEMNMYMQNQLLRDADVMSMAHGVEIRVPFLDAEVIKVALSIKSEIKYEGKRPKQSLINAFKEELPESVWNRKKMGFTFPFTQWMADSSFIRETMLQGSRASKANYRKFIEGRLHWSHLMSSIILQTRGIA